jgi:branched-chain amino acid aminotransferase
VDLERHLERLERSAARLRFPPIDLTQLHGELTEALRVAANPDAYVRVVVTRGRGPIGLDPALAGPPCRVIYVQPLRLPAPEVYARGLSAAIVAVERVSARALDPRVKSGNYLNGILALAEARERGADEAILCNPEGFVAEASAANVFVVAGGRVSTPWVVSGLLEGITRQRVLELGVVAIEEGDVHPDELRGADEVFITSSIRGIVPITRLDDQPVGAGGVGPLTRRVMDAYDAFLADVAAGKRGQAG